ncbi:hypothetical protein KCU90_g146, partial [Aureobasidium melanogenum]
LPTLDQSEYRQQEGPRCGFSLVTKKVTDYTHESGHMHEIRICDESAVGFGFSRSVWWRAWIQPITELMKRRIPKIISASPDAFVEPHLHTRILALQNLDIAKCTIERPRQQNDYVSPVSEARMLGTTNGGMPLCFACSAATSSSQ